jgi:ssDNA-binding Zn-finger/Zn-ribbon topoisomerase 1
MGILTNIANGLGTVLGVLSVAASDVISEIRTAYNNFRKSYFGGKYKEKSEEERTKEELRTVNDEILYLRNRRMSGGHFTDQDRRRWEDLSERRAELLRKQQETKEVRAAEKILAAEEVVTKVGVDAETTHILQYNAFADVIGKVCPKCGRQMKIQWRRDLAIVNPKDFYWGCTGWYFQVRGARFCTYTEALSAEDFGLLTDVSSPELRISSGELYGILSHTGAARVVDTRLRDLQSDLAAAGKGVQVASCPVHGEPMVLREKKNNPQGLMDAFFLSCPRWLPNGNGCPYIEKLKSPAQLAALLNNETGRGIL